MTIQDLVKVLSDAKFNVFLNDAPVGTECPYVVLTQISHPNFAADNKTFIRTTSLELVLVESEVHDWNLIKTLEETLDSIPLPYSSEDESIPSEHVCETVYDLTFLGGNTNG